MNVTTLDRLDTTGGPLLLRRAWPRTPEHLVLEYAGPAGALVAAQWLADPERRRRIAAATPGAVEIPSAGVLLQPGGADRRLTGLSAVLRQPGAVLVSHRAERRAVVRRADGAFVKVVPPGRTTAIAAAATWVGAGLAGTAAVPHLCEEDLENGLLVWSPLPGRTLHQLARDGAAEPSWQHAWRRTGSVLRALHASLRPETTPVRDVLDEHRSAERLVQAARALGLLPPGREVPLPAPAPSTSPVVTLHGDLHDKQVVCSTLAAGPEIGLLDLDGVSIGEAAIDVANVLVHLELRTEQGLSQDAAVAARTALVEGLRPDAAVLSRARELVDVVRLRLSGLYAFRPASRGAARALYDRVQERADDRGQEPRDIDPVLTFA